MKKGILFLVLSILVMTAQSGSLEDMADGRVEGGDSASGVRAMISGCAGITVYATCYGPDVLPEDFAVATASIEYNSYTYDIEAHMGDLYHTKISDTWTTPSDRLGFAFEYHLTAIGYSSVA